MSISIGNPRLYWGETKPSLWTKSCDLLFSTPFTDVALFMVRESRRSKPLTISHKSCAPYLDNSTLACTSLDDGKWMINEIFEKEDYSSVEEAVKKAKFIVDVGANIGTFSAWCAAKKAQASDEKLTILCVEPMPSTADACQLNIDQAMKKHPNTTIRVAHMGLASEEHRGNVTMTHFEDVPSCSTARPQDKHKSNIAPLLASESGFLEYYGPYRPIMCKLISLLPLKSLRDTARQLAVAYLWRWSEVQVNLSSLQDAMDSTKLEVPEKIDLLKVDIEGLELAVLDVWWKKIQQAILEVHDIDSRCDKVIKLLKSKGLKAKKQADDYYNDEIGMNHYMIVAHR